MTQLALPTAPTGDCDLGLYLTGEIDRPAYLPTAVELGSTREVERPCGCRRRERMGAALWVTTGAAGTRLCAAHKSWPVPL